MNGEDLHMEHSILRSPWTFVANDSTNNLKIFSQFHFNFVSQLFVCTRKPTCPEWEPSRILICVSVPGRGSLIVGVEQKPKPKLRANTKIGSCSIWIQEIPATIFLQKAERIYSSCSFIQKVKGESQSETKNLNAFFLKVGAGMPVFTVS